MGWSWYLANDFQMYAISPIFLFAFYKSKLLGILLIDLGIVASLIASGAIAYANDFSAYALDVRS
jgi:peptidoglycan/LPS O-acetylase OafA/YrhL